MRTSYRLSRRAFLHASAATAGILMNEAAGAEKKKSARTKKEDDSPLLLTKDDGYRGIWYFNQPQKDEYA